MRGDAGNGTFGQRPREPEDLEAQKEIKELLSKSLKECFDELASETTYTSKVCGLHVNLKQKKPRKMSKKTNVTSTTNTPPVENMKTKPGTAKPSGAGVGKGGPAASPTTGKGGNLKPGKGKKK